MYSKAKLASISKRRTYQLISGVRGLPPFLVANPGLNSGLMIPQYTAASIVSQNKQLCTPASADSIVSSNGQEDHVSMGANAATKCYQVVANVQRVYAIELLNASQAIEFRRPGKSSARREIVEEIPYYHSFDSGSKNHVSGNGNYTICKNHGCLIMKPKAKHTFWFLS